MIPKEQEKLLKKAGYSKKAIELYSKRINVGTLENADVETTYTGPCGDTSQIFLHKAIKKFQRKNRSRPY